MPDKTGDGLSFAHDGVGFHPTGRWCYIGCLCQGGGYLQFLTLVICSLGHLQCDGLHVYLNMIRVVVNN